MCQKVHCPQPKVFLDGNCSNLNTTPTSSVIDFYLRTEPNYKEFESKPDSTHVETVLSKWLTGILDTDPLFICNLTVLEMQSQIGPTPMYLVLYVKVKPLLGSNINPLIHSIVNYDYGNLTLLLGIGNWTMSLDGSSYGAGNLTPIYTEYRKQRVIDPKIRESCMNPVRITALSECSQFHIEASRISSRRGESVCLRTPNKCFPKDRYIDVDVSGTVGVCVQDYLGDQEWKASNKVADVAESLISLICNCLSVVCLSFTLLTYCLFSELRTIPGKNNMALATSMIIAQILFQFGLTATDNQLFCKIVGVCVHFFWLLTMFCMVSCSLHMFRTFVNITGSAPTMTSRPRDFVIYCVFSVMAATAFVLINIVYSILNSEHDDMGYGGDICYISSKIMIGATFALPVAIVFVSNKTMFFFVVYRIHNLPNVRKNSTKERSNFLIYIKLSTLTGGSWIFGFIYQWTEITAFIYLFIVATCCQGVFIMLSFVCNKRVMQLYISRCNKGRMYQHKSGNSNSRSSTVKSTSFSECLTNEHIDEQRL